MGLTISIFRSVLNSKLLGGLAEVDDDNRKIMKRLDNYTLTIVTALPATVLELEPINDDFIKTENIDLGWKKKPKHGGFDDWKKTRKPIDRTEIEFSRRLELALQTVDDNFGKSENKEFEVLKSGLAFPLKDKIVKVDDETALKLAKQLRLSPRDTEPRQASPMPYHDWTEMSSDEALSRIFFYGIGSVLMASMPSGAADKYKKEGLGPFVVDLPLFKLEVRRGFQPYGFRIHFDTDQKVTAIYDYVAKKLVKARNGGRAWERAKFITRITTFTVVTVREHLLWTHLILANTMTLVKSDVLPPSHPLRRLLTVFSFRTNTVNNAANVSLVPRLSLIHRATGLTIKALGQVFEAGFKECNIYEPFPKRPVSKEVKALSEAGRFPYLVEGAAWYGVVETFVKEWLSHCGDIEEDDATKEFYKEIVKSSKGQSYELPQELTREHLIDLLTQCIFTVTAYHEIVGTVVDYTEKPSYMGFRALGDNDSMTVDLQSYLIAAALTASTAIRMPDLVGQFNNFFGAGGAPEWERTCWTNFQFNLQVQSGAVRKADAARSTEFKNFDPARFECAVSV